MKLENKIAVVTGGGRGIGRAICLAFAREGADIVVAANVLEDVNKVSGEIEGLGRKSLPFVLDVTKPDQIQALVDKTIDTFGKVDILVNSAGIVGQRSFIFNSDDENWRKIIEINLFGTYYCMKAFLPKIMDQQAGRIINLGSIAGKQASPTNTAYAASKHGVIGITRSVAAEVALLGLVDITVNAICPGIVETTMVTGDGGVLDELGRLTGKTKDAVLQEHILPMSLQKRMQAPEEIADMAVYLASDSARSITGQAINVDSGTIFY